MSEGASGFEPPRHERGGHHGGPPHGDPLKLSAFPHQEARLLPVQGESFQVHNTYYIYWVVFVKKKRGGDTIFSPFVLYPARNFLPRRLLKDDHSYV